ncbi:MAG TPA: glycine cleavage T C-terminal barrel domain-containing protein, partial [Terrimesophilobacter sp.]|uniref:CAF17-like 4Fe-4S cluster assembly/insertion protein YgfZ n=1 Tax=Terrimesophilobacter sp. TaxID=2906435 RepID=UPI002F93037D
LAAGLAVVDLSQRAVLTVTGADRLTWLDSVTSQDLASLAPGGSAEALLLNPTGRIEHVLQVLDDGVTSWLLVEGQEAASLLAWLDSMRFMMRVEVADRSADYALIGTLGSPALAAAAPNGLPLVWSDPWSTVATGGHQYAEEPDHPASRWTWREFVIERASLAEAARLPVAGLLAFEALRIAAWRPRFGTEVDEKTIPHELDWLRSAVHLSKGCYRGQETVAKVHNLGHPPRRLVMLHLDGSESVLPAEGDEIMLGDKSVGRVTSAARHYELGPIALAVIKRNTDPDAVLTVTVGDTVVTAAQEVIVPPSAGATADVPRLPRLGGNRL